MDSESDDDGRARHSNVKWLVKKFTGDTKSDNVLSEQENDASDKDNDESLTKEMKTDLDDDKLNDILDDQEDYASAQENNDESQDQTNEKSDGNDKETEREIAVEKEEVEQVENNNDEDAEDRTFRRSFTTFRRSKTRRRQPYNTKPEDMTNEIKSDSSIENNEDSLQKAKRQEVDDTESNDDDSDAQEDELDIKEDEENDILDNEEDVFLHSDEVTEDDYEQHVNLDSSLDVDDSMLLKASKSNTDTDDIDLDDEISDNEEDIPIEDKCDDIKLTLNLRVESADKDVPSDEGEPNTISEIRVDDETTNNNSLTRFSKVNMHQFNEYKEQDNHQEQDDVSENTDKDSQMVQKHEQFTEDNFYSFIFKDPMADLIALTGRIVKDASIFQAATNLVPPYTYYEDENEIPVPPPEPKATEKEEPEELQQLEAQNLEQNEEEDDVRSEFEEEMLILEEALQEKESSLRINTNPLGKASQTYELERFEKNALIIFNQEKIPGFERRKGTIKDANDLASTFEKLSFEISSHIDQTKDEIFRKLEEFAATDFSDYGCVAVAVMTHGSGGFLRAKDRQYHETRIINYFKSHTNPTLVTKPKIIIIQACRGKKITPAVLVNQESMSPMGKIARDHDEPEPYTLPTESDILVLHSTYAGNPSHRDETYGSWFIQTLCKKIDDLANEFDLESIFTEVQREVAIDKEHKEWNIDTKKDEIGKQMPVKMSTLIRKLYLYKDKDNDIARHNPEIQSDGWMAEAAVKRDSNFSGITSDNFTPCACFLVKFLYLTDCMRYFVEDNPEDEVAKTFLETAESFGDGAEFNKPKEKFSRAIINHLKVHAEKCEYYKYLYL